MHVINLILGYGLGVKENVKMVSEKLKDGSTKKTKVIITPGGPFEDGELIVQYCKNLVNYFGSPQHKQELIDVIGINSLPEYSLKNPGETRVSSTVTLLQSVV